MHVNTIGEQEIWFLYFFNPYYFLTTYLKISAKLVYFLFKTPNFKPVYLRSALSDCDSVSFI